MLTPIIKLLYYNLAVICSHSHQGLVVLHGLCKPLPTPLKCLSHGYMAAKINIGIFNALLISLILSVSEPPSKRDRHESYYMTDNANYNGPFNFANQEEGDEAIYDEIVTQPIGPPGVGCRRHGVYAGNTEEMEPNTIYDVVL